MLVLTPDIEDFPTSPWCLLSAAPPPTAPRQWQTFVLQDYFLVFQKVFFLITGLLLLSSQLQTMN